MTIYFYCASKKNPSYISFSALARKPNLPGLHPWLPSSFPLERGQQWVRPRVNHVNQQKVDFSQRGPRGCGGNFDLGPPLGRVPRGPLLRAPVPGDLQLRQHEEKVETGRWSGTRVDQHHRVHQHQQRGALAALGPPDGGPVSQRHPGTTAAASDSGSDGLWPSG